MKSHTHLCSGCDAPILCEGRDGGLPDCPPHCEFDEIDTTWWCVDCGDEALAKAKTADVPEETAPDGTVPR